MGIPELSIILEYEAALVYCEHGHTYQELKEPDPIGGLRVKTKIIVVHIGKYNTVITIL